MNDISKDSPRKNSLRLKDFDYSNRRAYFVTTVAQNRQQFFTDKRIADSTIKCLLDLRERYKFNLYQYCLMPDHLHTVIGIGDSDMTLSRICGDFKSISTKEFWKFYKGKLWQRQFHEHVIRNEEDFWECVKYIRLNPVRKGLVENWQDWIYSGNPDL
jgi:putative transposase